MTDKAISFSITPSILFSIIMGAIVAVFTVQSPILGAGVIFGLFGFFILTRRPEIPFALLVLSLAIPVQRTIAGIPLNMADGMVVLWGLALPFLMKRKENANEPLVLTFMIWAALPLVISAILSLFVAVNFSGSLKQTIRLFEWFIILPILMMSFKPEPLFWQRVSLIFLCIPPLFALDGVVEVLNHGNSISRMLGIPPPIPVSHTSIHHTYDVSGRAGSTFGGAQGLAMYLAMMMSFVVSMILFPPKPIFRIIAFITGAMCIAGLVVAKSRGGFLGFIVMSTVIMLVTKPRLGMSIITIVGLLAVTGLFGFMLWFGWNGTITGLIPGRPEAVLDRLIIWSRAWAIFSENPLLGVGFSGFHDEVYRTGGIQLNVGLGYESLHCHNTHLEVLTGTGIIGWISYVCFLFCCFRRLIVAWKNRRGEMSDCFILAAIGALSAYMMFGMVDMLFLQNIHLGLVSIVSLGILAAGRNERVMR